MSDKATPADAPRRDPDPRSAFGNPDLAKANRDPKELRPSEVVEPDGGERSADELDPPVIDADDPDDLPVPIADHQPPCPED